MNNLDSLQTTNAPLPSQAAGARVRNTDTGTGSAPVDTGAENVQVLTPGGNALPPQAKPAPQSALQRTEQIEAVVEQLSDFAQSLQRALSFSVDDITGQTILTVTDSESEEVVRQIPSEELVELARKLQELEESREKLQDATGNLLQVRV